MCVGGCLWVGEGVDVWTCVRMCGHVRVCVWAPLTYSAVVFPGGRSPVHAGSAQPPTTPGYLYGRNVAPVGAEALEAPNLVTTPSSNSQLPISMPNKETTVHRKW